MQYKPYCGHLRYVSQDFAQYTGAESKDGLSVGMKWDASHVDIVSDIISIPVENDSFDNVLCTEVFEHISQPELAIKEFSRILKPGGRLFLTFPVCCLNHMAPYFYSSGYSKYMFQFWCETYGFMVEEITPNGNFVQLVRQNLGTVAGVAHDRGCPLNIISRIKIMNMQKYLKRVDKLLGDTSDIAAMGIMCVAKKL